MIYAAKSTVRRCFSGQDAAEVLSIFANDQHTAGAGRPNVAIRIDLHAIAAAFELRVLEWLCIEEDATVLRTAIVLQIISHHPRVLRVRHRYVERLLVWTQRDAIREPNIFNNE